jgi:hypothetical protein
LILEKRFWKAFFVAQQLYVSGLGAKASRAQLSGFCDIAAFHCHSEVYSEDVPILEVLV